MIIILVVMIVSMAFFLFYVRKEQVPDECDTSTVTKPFYKGGIWLTSKIVNNKKIKSALLQKN